MRTFTSRTMRENSGLHLAFLVLYIVSATRPSDSDGFGRSYVLLSCQYQWPRFSSNALLQRTTGCSIHVFHFRFRLDDFDGGAANGFLESLNVGLSR